MDGWKDYGNIEKEVLPESFRDRNLTACVSRFTLANHWSGERGAGLRTLDMEAEIRRQNYAIKHGVKVFSPTGVPFSGGEEALPEDQYARSDVEPASRTEHLWSIMLDAEPDRGVERMECEAVPPIKQKDRITGVQIRTATGRLEDLFAGRLLRRGCWEECIARRLMEARGDSIFVRNRPPRPNVFFSKNKARDRSDPLDQANTRRYRTATMDREALIFLHIPKPAGTTLNRTTLHSILRPGPFKNFYDSSLGIGRFSWARSHLPNDTQASKTRPARPSLVVAALGKGVGDETRRGGLRAGVIYLHNGGSRA
jgi:hypothetical protein